MFSYSVSLAGGGALPSWLSFNTSSGTFSGTPGSFDAGLYVLQVSATDTFNAALNASFSITVLEGTIINGTALNDTLTGTINGDRINGLDGNDILNGGTGADFIDGGNGNDTLNGGPGDDALSGAAGNDTINGEDGNDVLAGGDGIDILTGGNGNDTITAGAGNDTIVVSFNTQAQNFVGVDTVDAGTGADKISVVLSRTLNGVGLVLDLGVDTDIDTVFINRWNGSSLYQLAISHFTAGADNRHSRGHHGVASERPASQQHGLILSEDAMRPRSGRPAITSRCRCCGGGRREPALLSSRPKPGSVPGFARFCSRFCSTSTHEKRVGLFAQIGFDEMSNWVRSPIS